MASISNDAAGGRRIQFVAADGKRKAVRLGQVDRKTAEAVRLRVEKLVAAAAYQTAVDDETGR